MSTADLRPDSTPPVLKTSHQVAAEKLAVEIVALPETQAIWADLRIALRDDPAMQKPTGTATLNRSLLLWTTFLVLRETAADVARPQIIWGVDNSAHTWDGVNFPGSGVAGDNPDNIYRSTFINGVSSYEVHGRRPMKPPTQFSIEVTRGAPGRFVLAPQTSKTPDLGDQVALFHGNNIVVDADGKFVITLDTSPADGRSNHIQIEVGEQAINFRDTLADWNLRPYWLEIRRTAGPIAGPELTRAEIINRTLADMYEFILFWARFNKNWMGAPAPNTLRAPVPRDGGCGFLAGGHYDLADDEAIVFTTIQGGAKYTGVQVCNPWMMASDGALAITSRNLSQVTAGDNGEITYVISNSDPGAPNWIDTTGLRQGTLFLRWQHATPDTNAATLLRNFQIVKLADIKNLLPKNTAWVTPAQRTEELARRTAAYEQRLYY